MENKAAKGSREVHQYLLVCMEWLEPLFVGLKTAFTCARSLRGGVGEGKITIGIKVVLGP